MPPSDTENLKAIIQSLKTISEIEKELLLAEVKKIDKKIIRYDFQLKRILKDKSIVVNILNATIHDLEKSKQQLEKGVAMEVLQVYYALLSLQSKFKAEQAASASASKSMERFKTRYENDKALLIELLQAQNRKTTSDLTQLLTQYDFLLKKVELEKIISK